MPGCIGSIESIDAWSGLYRISISLIVRPSTPPHPTTHNRSKRQRPRRALGRNAYGSTDSVSGRRLVDGSGPATRSVCGFGERVPRALFPVPFFSDKQLHTASSSTQQTRKKTNAAQRTGAFTMYKLQQGRRRGGGLHAMRPKVDSNATRREAVKEEKEPRTRRKQENVAYVRT